MTTQRILSWALAASVSAATVPLATKARAEAEDLVRGIGPIKLVATTAPSETAEAPKAEPAEAALAPKSSGRARSTRVGTDSGRISALRPLIAKHAAEHGIPLALADAVVRLESRYNAGARNGPNLGLTQINARTAQSIGYDGPAGGLLDPETNLRYGFKYLAQAYKLAGGDTCGTILRYQAGLRATSMTQAARTYCGKVKTIFASAE